jgi:hypothetical protein
MRVVYNTKGFGLRLSKTEMNMFCKLRGYTLRNHDKPISSTSTWFVEVDWMEFRADPLLVRLVEHKMLSNQDLDVCDVEGAWHIDTDWLTYEEVENECPTCMSCQDDIADYEEGYCVYCDPKQFEDEDLTEGETA